MRYILRSFLLGSFVMFSAVALCFSQSLGDVARAQREKQQQAKNTKAAHKVITDEDMPKSAESSSSSVEEDKQKDTVNRPSDEKGSRSADEWKEAIQAQKNNIASAQAQLDGLKDSIQFAPGNCVSGCVEWNERQVKKQEAAKRMQSQIDEGKKKLEDMQETARKSGFGSSVWDP